MDTRAMPVLDLSGDPKSRGRAYGETLRAKIRDYCAIGEAAIARRSGQPPYEFLDEFLDGTRFEHAIERHTPGLLGELDGLADGAGVDRRILLGINLEDETFWFYRARKRGVPIPVPGRCSVAGGVNGASGVTWLGQNMDIGSCDEGYQVLLRIRERADDPPVLVFSVAGKLGLNGANGYGLGVCCNTLIQLDPRPDGLPVTWVLRGLLQQRTYAQACEFLHRVPHASGQCYSVAAPGVTGAWECSANSVVAVSSGQGEHLTWHTNHPLASSDQALEDRYRLCADHSDADAFPFGSDRRLQCLARRLTTGNEVSLDSLKAAFSSHDDPDYPVCRDVDCSGAPLGYTFGCSIYELRQDGAHAFHIAAGPPNITPFLRIVMR